MPISHQHTEGVFVFHGYDSGVHFAEEEKQMQAVWAEKAVSEKVRGGVGR